MRLATLPRFPLILAPTPLARAQRLEQALGAASPRIYIKRDDLTGLAFGGNKSRKLEYLVADARKQGATVLVTEGAAQSNHARMTAAAARLAGLKAVLVLDARNGSNVTGNLLLDYLMDVDVRLVPDRESRRRLMATISDELRAAGEEPYLIPTGGSVPLGAVGYVRMIQELMTQLDEIGEAPGRLYFATASLGTHAGLDVGARAFSAPFRIHGIAVDGTAEGLATEAAELANDTANLLGLEMRFTADQFAIDDRHIGPGYGKPTESGLRAIRLLARTEAVFLDPVYSGKAMAGMLDHIDGGELGKHDSIIFLHTGGGPSIFGWGETLLANHT